MSVQSDPHPQILQVSTADAGGGAERVALDLHGYYLEHGLSAALALGRMTVGCDGCFEIDNDGARSPLVRAVVSRLPQPTGGMSLRVRQAGRALAEPGRAWRHAAGLDDFDYPATRTLLDSAGLEPGVLHLHNLHGGYFDLRALPELTAAVPTAITLHDTWMLAGHCAYALDCSRWLNGCGACPYPSNPPAMRRDASARNWANKAEIYGRSRLHVVGPSQWILDEAARSMLAPAIESATLIRNGVDQRVFSPGDRAAARAALGVPADARVVMFAANNVTNVYKDFATLLDAIPQVARMVDEPLVVLAVGAKAGLPGLDEQTVRLVPFTSDRAAIARYLHASDVFVHATRADNYPLTTLEAQSCGVPVVVTDVGGAAETIEVGTTGLTYTTGDASGLAQAVARLLTDDTMRRDFGEAALAHAREHHSLDRMAQAYLDLYDRIGRVSA